MAADGSRCAFHRILTSNASAAPVGRITVLLPSPSLDACRVTRTKHDDVAGGNILDNLESAIILTNTANGNPLPVPEDCVLDEDIRRVGFCGNTVISVFDFPSTINDGV